MNEDRYEAIEMIIKCREDGVSWFDYFTDQVTEECEGTDSDEDDCTCGLISAGGSTGTLQQCYEWSLNIAAGISPIMVARAVIWLDDANLEYAVPPEMVEVIEWARKEIEFEEMFEEREDDEEETTEVR